MSKERLEEIRREMLWIAHAKKKYTKILTHLDKVSMRLIKEKDALERAATPIKVIKTTRIKTTETTELDPSTLSDEQLQELITRLEGMVKK